MLLSGRTATKACRVALPLLFLSPDRSAASPPVDIDKIASIARQICLRPDMVGVSRQQAGAVKGSASVSGLMKKMLEGGISAEARVDQKNWQGVTQGDLSRAIADSNRCSQNMFKLMFDRFYLSTAPTLIKPSSKPKLTKQIVSVVPQKSSPNQTASKTELEGFQIWLRKPGESNDIYWTSVQVGINNYDKMLIRVQGIGYYCRPSTERDNPSPGGRVLFRNILPRTEYQFQNVIGKRDEYRRVSFEIDVDPAGLRLSSISQRCSRFVAVKIDGVEKNWDDNKAVSLGEIDDLEKAYAAYLDRVANSGKRPGMAVPE